MPNPKGIMMDAASAIDLNVLVDKLQTSFPMPHIYARIMEEINNPNSTTAAFEKIFKNDPNLTLEILKLANSAYYGMPGKVTSIRSAIVLLGINLIRGLVLQTSVSNLLVTEEKSERFSGYDLWKHSVGVGVVAKMISRRLRQGNAEDYFTLGILHDIGLFIEYRFYATPFLGILARLQGEKEELIQIEHEVFGTDHAALTQLLCEKWGMPDTITQVVGWHHSPLQAPELQRKPACIINLANYVVHQNQYGFTYPGPHTLNLESV
jgi:HD-like signal output (HDOD) protein